MEGEAGAAAATVTVSYDEGGRWLDGGHSVDGVAMPPAIFAWVGEYVEKNYRPEPKKRIKPRSFMHPKDRVGPMARGQGSLSRPLVAAEAGAAEAEAPPVAENGRKSRAPALPPIDELTPESDFTALHASEGGRRDCAAPR